MVSLDEVDDFEAPITIMPGPGPVVEVRGCNKLLARDIGGCGYAEVTLGQFTVSGWGDLSSPLLPCPRGRRRGLIAGSSFGIFRKFPDASIWRSDAGSRKGWHTTSSIVHKYTDMCRLHYIIAGIDGDLAQHYPLLSTVKTALRPKEDYFAIVYEFVPDCGGGGLPATAAEMQRQLDFFWLIRLFMDMSDLVCPWSTGWSGMAYGRLLLAMIGIDNFYGIGSTDDDDGTDSTDNDGGDGSDSSLIAGVLSPRGGRHGIV
ncbi:hypothetical protein QBC46DRAFT_338662 [Diplogelasinospora grovesii]|uniref:Uncharacterized protein n=1 Tax=Diplogelasinospora grovesii TaxID=303347 RepID=A0AAN6S6Y4_9PEZI|nr:hypothetical protein QBC46DRAFT_338662 [Diplogelasinospora grovesii]